MKQAIQEGFILDVLKSYTPVDSYYKLVKTVESDPEFDTKRAKKKLRRYVESHDHAIRLNPENVQAFVGIGETLRQAGNMRAAQIWYRKALRLEPHHPVARQYLK